MNPDDKRATALVTLFAAHGMVCAYELSVEQAKTMLGAAREALQMAEKAAIDAGLSADVVQQAKATKVFD